MKHSEVEEDFKRHGPQVLHRARGLLGDLDEAKDVLQEVFISFAQLAAFDVRRGSVSTWLYRVTTNRCLNRLRDADRRRRLATLRARTMDAVVLGTDADTRILVRALLAGAEERSAEAAVYVHVDGMSHAEAAELLGVSRKTVGNLLERFGRHAARSTGRDDELRSEELEEPA